VLIARYLVTVIASSLPVFLVLSKMRPDGVCRDVLLAPLWRRDGSAL